MFSTIVFDWLLILILQGVLCIFDKYQYEKKNKIYIIIKYIYLFIYLFINYFTLFKNWMSISLIKFGDDMKDGEEFNKIGENHHDPYWYDNEGFGRVFVLVFYNIHTVDDWHGNKEKYGAI